MTTKPNNNMGIAMSGGGALPGYAAHPQQHLQGSVNMANSAYAHNQQAYHQAAARQAVINAANQYNSQFKQMPYQQQQQMLGQMYNQAMSKAPKPYRFNGKDMDAEEFANTLFPDDCPEKTYILLKMKGNEDE